MYNVTLFCRKDGEYVNVLAQQDDENGSPLCRLLSDWYVHKTENWVIKETKKRIRKQLKTNRCHWVVGRVNKNGSISWGE